MKMTFKIALYSLWLLLTPSWVAIVVTILNTSSEKNIIDKKDVFPGDKSDVEEITFEIVSTFTPSYHIPIVNTNTVALSFNTVTSIPQSVFLDLSNPPPEFNLVA